MGCFIVPAAEAIVTTVVTKIVEKKEAKFANDSELKTVNEVHVEKFSAKLKRLNGMLWGGSALLAFEHIWHGEVTAFFPFLTAAESPEALAEMLTEMSTVGVGMAVAVTCAWGAINLVTGLIDKRTVKNNI